MRSKVQKQETLVSSLLIIVLPVIGQVDPRLWTSGAKESELPLVGFRLRREVSESIRHECLQIVPL